MYSTRSNIKQALELSWKHKLLWVVGLLLVAGSSGVSGNLGGSGNTTKEESIKTMETLRENDTTNPVNINISPEELTSENNEGQSNAFKNILSDVKGTSTSNPVLENYNYFDKYSGSIFILGAILLVVLLPLSIIIGVVIRAWATGAMVGGTIEGHKSDKLSLRILGKYALNNLGGIIKLQIYAMFIVFGVLIISMAVNLIGVLANTVVGIILTLPISIIVILTLLKVTFATTFGARAIVTKHLDFKDAYNKGKEIYVTNTKNTLKLMLGNFLVSGGSMILIVIGIFSLTSFLSVAVFSKATDSNTLVSLLPIITLPLVVLVSVGFMALRGYMKTFANFTWTTLYTHIDKGNDVTTVPQTPEVKAHTLKTKEHTQTQQIGGIPNES